jgi:3-oxo-5-alpha-steroid 4-dehydrogenase 1
MGFLFNLINAYLNARWLSELGSYTIAWLWSPAFIIGLTLFVTGYRINRWADRVLANLRAPGETGYKIPRGGLYELISCPNYFGELLEWTGFPFVAFTAANLVPRALATTAGKKRLPAVAQGRRALVHLVIARRDAPTTSRQSTLHSARRYQPEPPDQQRQRVLNSEVGRSRG